MLAQVLPGAEAPARAGQHDRAQALVAGEPERRARFEREARAVAALRQLDAALAAAQTRSDGGWEI